MVEYAYRNLFYKSQQTKDILIVDSEATVTPNTGTAPTVDGATVEIHTADIKIDSFNLDEKLCSADDLTWGLMESAKVEFSIKNAANIPNLKKSDYSKMVNIYIYFNGDSSTLFQVGQYVCESDKYTNDRRLRNIVLYDALYFIYNEDITEWYNGIFKNANYISIKNLRDSLFAEFVSEYDYPFEQEDVTLVNDLVQIPKNIESDSITFGFFMSGILNANGVFGHIGRDGKFQYKTLVKYDEATVATVTDDFRKPPTTYEDFAVWGIGYVAVFNEDGKKLIPNVGSSSYKRPSIYSIIDNFVLTGIFSKPGGVDELKAAVANIREQVTHRRYAPMNVDHVGDLCIEVGDNVAVTGDIGTYNTYVLERHLKGLGSMIDTYTSKGNRKQPKYKENGKYHGNESSEDIGTSGQGADGISTFDNEHDKRFLEIMRNAGKRFLAEPTDVLLEYDDIAMEVSVKWSDPTDIATSEPEPITWGSTIVIRKEDSVPLNRYDGTVLVTSTTRDAYSETAFVDNTIEKNKKYYYGIFPIGTNGNVTFTKIMVVDTTEYLLAPIINSIERIA